MTESRFAGQIDEYRRDGVVRVRRLFDEDQVSELRKNIERYQSELVPGLPAGDYTLEPDRRSIRNLWRMQEHDPYFASLAERSTLRDLVRPLVNGEPVLMGVETFNKPALVGSAVPPHQDNAYFCQSPPDVLTVWVAVDPATIENGAVEYSLGSHRELLPHVASGVKGNSFGLAELPPADRFKRFHGTVDPGDALVHHSQTIHQSEPNRTAHSRLSLIFVYRGEQTRTDERLQEEYRRAQTAAAQNA
ncbi:MAG: phytanoyl-CoA dioxygenase family protein [Planctomycetaceae bacterium]